jgi:multiple sugar transport system permease protein/sn-glycerol 3-phosphate transport system permease protein
VPARLLVALLLAQLLVAETRGVRFLRGVFFMPYVASTSAIAVIWSWMFQTDAGLINMAFAVFGLGPRSWLYDPATALAAVALVNAWKQIGYDIVLFVAGVQAISPALYEAARIDGASRLQQFRTITLPLLTPTLLFLLVVSVIDTFQVFTLVNVMTRGGPAGATDLIVHYFYRIAFIRFDYGDASVIAVLLLAGLLTLTALKLGVFGRRVQYDIG